MEPLKPHLSIENQVELLIDRGLIISDIDSARRFLSTNNYYRFTGYLHDFKIPGSNNYAPGLTFEYVRTLYEFDKKLTRILMYALEDIEETLKTRVSYNITTIHADNPLIYLSPDIYKAHNPYMRFLDHFNDAVRKNAGLPFVKHHQKKYGGRIPFWVAVELLTMGNIHSMYDNFQTYYQKQIAKDYGTSVKILSSWIENLTYTRNHLAHYMRIYNFKFGRTPMQCDNHHTYKVSSQMIFDQILVMSFMYSDPSEWDSYVLSELSRLFETYKDSIQLSCLGFPDNWLEILKRTP